MSSAAMSNNISVFIPRVFPNLDEAFVMQVFDKLSIGQVGNVDFVLKYDEKGKRYNAAYVHFNYWYDTTAARNLQERILHPENDKPALLVYDDPWRWILLESTAEKHPPIEGDADWSLVHESYVTKLEAELFNVRNQLFKLQHEYNEMAACKV